MGKSFQVANSGHNINWHYSSCVPGLLSSIDIQDIEDPFHSVKFTFHSSDNVRQLEQSCTHSCACVRALHDT